MKGRSATSVIWKTVVYAGAMLGAPACHGGAATPASPEGEAHAAGPSVVDDDLPAEAVETEPDDPGPAEAPADPAPAPAPDGESAAAEVEAVADPAAPDPVAADEVAMVTIRIQSSPAGAKVYLVGDSHLLGKTPLELRRPRGGDDLTARLVRSGYKEAHLKIRLDEDQDLAVKLAKEAKPRKNGGEGAHGRGFILS
ncbi:MAG: PEGA domain-containing protein [Kofleriaceae bacterium]|nr:PEGA domain-containing protein [Kofleriaceae bacterium]MCB9572669.1 PEGA domain-containing protein [Kofleriaceae bacterium]